MDEPRASGNTEAGHPSRLDRLGLGGRDAPGIYGSLLATTLIAVQWRYDPSVELIAFSLLVSIGVFWITHVWVELVDRRVRGPITRADAAHAGRAELPMLAAGVLPALALGLAWLGVTTVDQAIGTALAACIAQLFLWGLAAGHALGRGWPVALVVTAVDGAMGLVIVVLKVAVIH